MSSPAKPPSDASLLAQLGVLLRLGSVASALLILVGGVIYLAEHGGDRKPDLSTFPLVEATSPDGIGRTLVQLGLLLLIATPVVRVLYSVVAFLFRCDWLYFGLTLFVFLVLLVGLFGGPRR